MNDIFPYKEAKFRDGTMRILIPNEIISHCAEIASQPPEDGGYIVGVLEGHTAIITRLICNIQDSVRKDREMFIGKEGVIEKLHDLFKLNEHYLGKWHTHPLSCPQPSSIDVDSLIENTIDSGYNAPEQFMLIFGGTISNPKFSCTLCVNGRIYDQERGD